MTDHQTSPVGEDAERAAFEAWSRPRNPVGCLYAGTTSPDGWYYFDDSVNDCWTVWKAARRATPALDASGLPTLPEQSVDVICREKCRACNGMGSTGNMLSQGYSKARTPEPCRTCAGLGWTKIDGYTAEQVRQAQREAVASRDAEIVDLRAQLAQHERAYKNVVDTLRGAAHALLAARDMVGHPDNVAFIDRALADPEALVNGAAPAAGTVEKDAELIAELERLRSRFGYIEDNATTHGGGHGFTVSFFVPEDSEDIGCGIDAAIEAHNRAGKEQG